MEDRRTKVEFIESYIKIGNSDYRWCDNHGELIRCKDCKHWDADEHDCNIKTGWFACGADWFCADGEPKDRL